MVKLVYFIFFKQHSSQLMSGIGNVSNGAGANRLLISSVLAVLHSITNFLQPVGHPHTMFFFFVVCLFLFCISGLAELVWLSLKSSPSAALSADFL